MKGCQRHDRPMCRKLLHTRSAKKEMTGMKNLFSGEKMSKVSTWVSWAWLTWGSWRGVELVESSADPPGGAAVVPLPAGASPLVEEPAGTTLGAKEPVDVPSSSGRAVPSRSLARRSWITGSPLSMWQRMASMDSAILPPYTFSGLLFHRLRMQLNAALREGTEFKMY